MMSKGGTKRIVGAVLDRTYAPQDRSQSEKFENADCENQSNFTKIHECSNNTPILVLSKYIICRKE